MQDLRSTLLGDGAALRDILALAGPDIAPRLLAQIVTDLSATSRQLAPALAARDWAQIRVQSHVLISLAGTIGAMDLHAAACCMNEAAHGQDEARLSSLAPSVTADLAALVRLVAAQSDAANAGDASTASPPTKGHEPETPPPRAGTAQTHRPAQ
jgi:HPt (histidine-containing phosphotransfer) domain-containing protein